MKRILHSLMSRLTGARRSPARPARRARVSLEALEDRMVPAITSMTQLAQQFPTHAGPTHLYLNFDGYSANGISAFTGTGQDVEEVLYRTSEIFAPFNVEVSRLSGNGQYDQSSAGNTTIFVGASKGLIGANGVKVPGAWTPATSLDYPGALRGGNHALNSDPYDVAYVDPVGEKLPDPNWVKVWSNIQISQAVAHEAGHTFGLAHVLAAPVNEIMSYNSNNLYFANKSFTITNLNYNAKTGQTLPDANLTPSFNGSTIVTQNSYTTLESALGDRPFDNQFHVVHSGAVDPNSNQLMMFVANFGVGKSVDAAVDRTGDYDVYRVDASTTQTVYLDVTAKSAALKPVVLIFDDSGNLLSNGALEGQLNKATGHSEVHTSLMLQAGQRYNIVVGGGMDTSTGGYHIDLWVPFVPPFPFSLGGSSAGAPANQPSAGSSAPSPAPSHADVFWNGLLVQPTAQQQVKALTQPAHAALVDAVFLSDLAQPLSARL